MSNSGPYPEAENRPTPMTRAKVIEAYFLEHRGKLLDVAAFLDRVDRATATEKDGSPAAEDFRIAALRRAAALLLDGRSGRARRMLELLSDGGTDPVSLSSDPRAYGAPPSPSRPERAAP